MSAVANTGGRLRVLRIITTLEPEVGGPSMSAANAAVAEQLAGVTTTIVSTTDPHAPPYSPQALEDAGVSHRLFRRSRAFPQLGKRWGLSVPFAVWILGNARRYDVIHVHYVWSVGTLLGVLAGAVVRRPVVMTPHESLTSFGIENSRSGLRQRQKRAVRRLLLRGVDRVVTASTLELEDSLLSSEQGRAVAHPVPEAKPTRETAEGSGPHDARIGFLGRLHPKKRVDDLVEAFTGLSGRPTLTIGGAQPPEELERLRAFVRRSPLGDRVEFLGFVAPDQRDAMLSRLDVLVMPSTYECFGMVAAEALSAGVPVIVTDRTGIADIVREFDAGIVVPVGRPDLIRSALIAVLSDPARRSAMRQNARRAADEKLSFRAYASAIRATYDEVADARCAR